MKAQSMRPGPRDVARASYLGLCFLVAACNGDGAASAGGRQDTSARRGSAGASDTVATISHIEPPVSRDRLIVASDYAFRGLPTHAHAGWLTLRLANVGKETHMLSVARIPTGYTPAAFVDSLVHLRIAPTTTWWSGVDVVSPGDTAVVTAFFPAGAYAVTCFVASGDGAMHVVKGMVGSFDVIAARDTGAAPNVDGVVTLTRSHIGLRGAPVTSGVRTLRVVSGNSTPQDFQILKVLPGRSVQDALAWFTHRTTLAPAAEAVGGVSSIHSGQRASVTVRFTPGVYLLFFSVDEADPHSGLVQRTLTIPPTRNSAAE
jgi:hypothetical protein